MYLFDVHIRDEKWLKSVVSVEAESEEIAIDKARKRFEMTGRNTEECTLIGVNWTGYVTEFWKGKKLRGPQPRNYPYFKELDHDEPPVIRQSIEQPSKEVLSS